MRKLRDAADAACAIMAFPGLACAAISLAWLAALGAPAWRIALLVPFLAVAASLAGTACIVPEFLRASLRSRPSSYAAVALTGAAYGAAGACVLTEAYLFPLLAFHGSLVVADIAVVALGLGVPVGALSALAVARRARQYRAVATPS